jgi:hypothetical protein
MFDFLFGSSGSGRDEVAIEAGYRAQYPWKDTNVLTGSDNPRSVRSDDDHARGLFLGLF